MTITKLKLESPTKGGKSPRVTIAIEPEVAQIFRQLAKHEGMQLSQLLEQALVAWLRKWRPEYKLEVQGPEGPWRGRPIAVGDDDLETERPRANLKTLGLARKIHREQARSMEGFTANPAKKRGGKRKTKKKTGAKR
jgi:hypothetical protein